MTTSETVGWNVETEKLLCLIVLDDTFGPHLSNRAAPAYFRAFIVQDRTTGEITLKFRYSYRDPKEKNWYHVKPPKEESVTAALERLRDSVEFMLRGAYRAMHDLAPMPGNLSDLPAGCIEAFYPPDDGGDGGKTVIWLEMKDLVEITAVEHIANEA